MLILEKKDIQKARQNTTLESLPSSSSNIERAQLWLDYSLNITHKISQFSTFT